MKKPFSVSFFLLLLISLFSYFIGNEKSLLKTPNKRGSNPCAQGLVMLICQPEYTTHQVESMWRIYGGDTCTKMVSKREAYWQIVWTLSKSFQRVNLKVWPYKVEGVVSWTHRTIIFLFSFPYYRKQIARQMISFFPKTWRRVRRMHTRTTDASDSKSSWIASSKEQSNQIYPQKRLLQNHSRCGVRDILKYHEAEQSLLF